MSQMGQKEKSPLQMDGGLAGNWASRPIAKRNGSPTTLQHDELRPPFAVIKR
jgi:hypothetical protein